MTPAQRVAVIGLGRMGGPMADHVIGAGHTVRVHDVDPAAVAARVAAGGTAAAGAAEAAEGADMVCVVVFDDAQARDVVAGAGGVLRTLAAGAVIGIHTTVTVETVHELAAAAAPHGVTVLDAGISGGEAGAAAGTLLTMVGGPADAVGRARPVFEAFSKEVLHAGALGAGMALKLARNSTGYVMMAAVHEAMELAGRAGVDLHLLRHVIAETGIFDQSLAPLAFGGPDPLPSDEAGPLRDLLVRTLRLGEKDLDQALALGARLGAPTPVTAEVRRTFHRVTRLGDVGGSGDERP
jgi:3-hydroxyisobutyrate dehydrogenase-like beta-hydroxyacid dehydrogenase